jgi:hypothetical protein
MSNQRQGQLGIILYFIGILLGMLFSGAVTWSGIEADFYFGYGVPAEEPIKKFACPLLLTQKDKGSVAITLVNPSQKPILPITQMDISGRGLLRSERKQASIMPGEQTQLKWDVTRDDVVFGHLILANAYVFKVSALPSRKGSCGILWLDTNLVTGNWLVVLVLASSLLCIAMGTGIWLRNRKMLGGQRINRFDRVVDIKNSFIALIVIVLLGLLVSCLRFWGAGLICLIISLLIISAMFMQWAQS